MMGITGIFRSFNKKMDDFVQILDHKRLRPTFDVAFYSLRPGTLSLTRVNFNPCTRMSNYMPNKLWHETTYSFPKFNGCTVEV